MDESKKQLYGRECNMKEISDITFSPEVEELAIKLAAFDIMKQLFDDGKITKIELQYIAKKHNIPIDRE